MKKILSIFILSLLVLAPLELGAQSSDSTKKTYKKKQTKKKTYKKRHKKKHTKKRYKKRKSTKKRAKKSKKRYPNSHKKHKKVSKKSVAKKTVTQKSNKQSIKKSIKKATPQTLETFYGWSEVGGVTFGMVFEKSSAPFINSTLFDLELSALLGLGGPSSVLQTNAFSLNALLAYKINLGSLSVSLKAGPALRHAGTGSEAVSYFYNYGASIILDLEERGKFGLSYYADAYGISYTFVFK